MIPERIPGDMSTIPVATAVDLIALIVAALGSLLFTGAGLVLERAGIVALLGGQTTLGLWELAMGGIFIGVGLYVIGYNELWPRIA